jgi:hypothetical protein
MQWAYREALERISMKPIFDIDQEDRLRAVRLMSYIEQQCVILKSDNNGNEQQAIDWCRTNIGDERICHPMHEVMEGALDFFEGDWAYDIVDGQRYSFWFANKDHRMQFKLIWC